MKLSYKIYILFLFSILSVSPLFSQAYQFKTYGVDNGITQPYIYSITQGKNGYLWVGTGDGLCKFDGISFKAFHAKDGIAENFITSSYKDESRNLWFGHNQGGITFYDGKKFKVINTSGFAKSSVTCIVGDDKGYIWCATQSDGVFRISKNFEVDVFKVEFNQENIFSIGLTKNNQLIVGTDDGMMVYDLIGSKRKPSNAVPVISIPETKITRIVKKNNSSSFWVGTEDKGLFLLTPPRNKKEQFKANQIGKDIPVQLTNIQDIYEDPASNLWIATFGNGVVKLNISKTTLQYYDYQRFSDDNGLGNKYTKIIYSDHENNIWVGTYGSGLVQLTDNSFTFYSHTNPDIGDNVSSVLVTENIKWLGVENGLIKADLTSDQNINFFSKKNGFVDDKVTSLFLADKDHLIVGTDKNGVFDFDIAKNKFSKIKLNDDLLSASVNNITGSEKTLWIATKNGVFKIDPDKKITHYNTENGLTHNNINQIFLDHNKTLWIATHSNFISYIDKSATVQHKKIYDGGDLIMVTGLLEDKRNNIWVCTFGNGVFKIEKDTILKYTAANGLKSNYCYSIIRDGANNVWVGHQLGLSRIQTSKNSIDIFDKEDGFNGDCNYTAFYEDENGDAWFGTTKGVIKFDPRKDKKNLIPPIVNIISFKLNDKEIDYAKDTIFPSDNYRMRIDFIGISFKANTHVAYQYKLEGYDVDWSDKTFNNFAQYGKLSEGEYNFLIKAYNNDGISNPVPFSVKIVIAPPIWKRPWFIILMIAIVLYSFYLIVKTRERNHRKFQAQLQKALNEKTREVVIQKEEIEKKNKDITDSIRYAKRIQDAILPDLESLRMIVPESFVFFQPRDIVSGDFYWFNTFGSKLIIACADATGHGVPGAFMSMIGSTILKDITSRLEVTSPAHILSTMDQEIKILLKQNEDDQRYTNDSVDIVICEIDLETYFMRICSTKRPVFVSIDNKIVILKKENTSTQSYDTTDIQLKKGDIIYSFTDGYPDQFGGDSGKKIKVSNLKTLLENIQNLPIKEQGMAVDKYFNRWKEGQEQIDDVLFFGIKLI